MYVCTYVLVCPCLSINGPLTRVDHLPVTHVIPHVQAAGSNLRWHRFTRYHKRWLADHVQTEEEESCGQWLLHQSPVVATVREAEEYRPGRVRYLYKTMAEKVRSEWTGGMVAVVGFHYRQIYDVPFTY